MKLRLDHPLFQRLMPILVRQVVKGWLATSVHRVEVHPETQDLLATGRPYIFTAWHCHLLSTIFYWSWKYRRGPDPVLMASPSRDGEFIGQVAQGLGFIVCPGSRQKGGVQALKQMAAYLRQGHSGGLIADGSRGPARIAQKGVLYLARETQAPIIPAAAIASRKITLNTWDRFEIPLPFSRLRYLLGPPLTVLPGDRGPALEEKRRELEARLNRLCQLGQRPEPG